jgi:hypothetical protein
MLDGAQERFSRPFSGAIGKSRTAQRPQTYVVVCCTALLCTLITPATAEPYDIMVGCWTGKADWYDPKGVYQGSDSSRGGVSWKQIHRVLHFFQDQTGASNFKSDALRAAVTQSHQLEYDLEVDGKSAIFRSTDVDVTGTEEHPQVFHFLLNFKSGPSMGNWYNNHFFTSRNIRLVLGSFEPAGTPGQIQFAAAQTLKRVSCASKDYERERR